MKQQEDKRLKHSHPLQLQEKQKVEAVRSSGLRRCDKNRKVPGSNPTRHSAGLRDQPRYEVPGDLRVEIVQTQ